MASRPQDGLLIKQSKTRLDFFRSYGRQSKQQQWLAGFVNKNSGLGSQDAETIQGYQRTLGGPCPSEL